MATAGGDFWGTKEGTEKCCECHTGKWHGLFKKRTAEEANYEPEGGRFWQPKGGWK